MEDFDYNEAVRKLELIAAKVEDPSTGIDDIDKYIKEASCLIAECRTWLRSARDKVSAIDE